MKKTFLPVWLMVSWLSSPLLGVTTPYTMTWQANGFINRRDVADAVVVDPNGNIYVGGKTEQIYGVTDNQPRSALVAKYNSTGSREWLSYAYSTPGLDHVSGMAIDASSNLVIAGETYRYAPGAETFVVKFSQNGTKLWERHLGSPDNEFGQDVAVDGLNNIYVAGSTTGDLGVGNNGSGYDGFVVKYDPSGTKLWSMQLPDSVSESVSTIAVDSLGNFFASGSKQALGQEFIAKFDVNRSMLWNINPNYSTSSSLKTQIYESAADPLGNLIVVGMTNGNYNNSLGFTSYDGVVAKHDSSGNLLWQYQFGGPSLTTVGAVTVDSLGNVYVSGNTSANRSASIAGQIDSFWAKLDPSGNLAFIENFGVSEGDVARDIAVDLNGTVYAAGTITRDVGQVIGGDVDAYLARFDAVPEPTVGALLLLAMTMLLPARSSIEWK